MVFFSRTVAADLLCGDLGSAVRSYGVSCVRERGARLVRVVQRRRSMAVVVGQLFQHCGGCVRFVARRGVLVRSVAAVGG